MNKIVALLFLLLSAQWVMAKEPILRIESTISGNQEQPKVFSIVPWQDIPEPKYIGENLEFELNRKGLEQLSRTNFQLEVQYIQAIREK